MIDRNQNILQLLVIESLDREDAIMKKLNMSQRQLDYSLNQINQQLRDAKISPIEKVNGKLIYASDLKNVFLLKTKAKDVVLSADNRYLLIPFAILIRSEELSLDHLSFILGVSKNTVLNDLKKSGTYLKQFSLEIEYTRQDGYYIIGSEWNKRTLLKKLSDHFYILYGKSFIVDLLNEGEFIYDEVSKSINEAEDLLKLQFTDEDFYYLTVFVTTILVRIKQESRITFNLNLELKEIKNTDHFRVMEYVFQKFKINTDEVLYLTLYLLGSKARVIESPEQINLPKLSHALWEFLGSFEENTLLVLVDKQQLHEKLLNHFKPAYYRIKYNLNFENVLYEHIVKKYSVLHQFVQQSVEPLEHFFGEKIDDHEISYITLFVGGHLFDAQGNKYESLTVNAVIVCPSGISMSRLIEKEIKTLFPEFQFYQPISLREYESFLLPHNIVFSTVPLESSKQVYIVKGIMDQLEKINLRRIVIGDLYQLNFDAVDLNKTLEIINRHTKIKNEEKLKQELLEIMIPQGINKTERLNHEMSITKIISEDAINVIDKPLKWDKALEIMGNNLIMRDIVTQDYVTELKKMFYHQPEYIMLRRQILIPHLDPLRVPQKLGLSVLVNKQGIDYQGEKIYIAMCLTTPNKIDHLNILMNIRDIAMNKECIQKLKNSTDEKEALRIIINYFTKG